MLVTSSQMKAAEKRAFQHGGSAAALMEVAGRGIAEVVRKFFPTSGVLVVFCGKGHNGGDALVTARHLEEKGWRILIRLATPVAELAPLTRSHLSALPTAEMVATVPRITGLSLLLLDGLLGIGSCGAPHGITATLIEEMNELRRHSGGFSLAVDVPSGLDATSGECFDPCIQADLTVTLGAVKTGLLKDRATSVVGRLALVPLPGVVFDEGDPAEVATEELLRPLLPTRNYDTHKGIYGRIGILAGSRGTLGAARLASAAAVYAGGGLVTLYTLPDCYDLLAALCIPEIMVRPVDSFLEILEERHDALAIGPGLGCSYAEDLRTIIQQSPCPCVLDADALNLLARDISLLKHCVGSRLLTPHPVEMERLFPAAGRSRREWAEEFVRQYPVTLLLKGARTVIVERNARPIFNTTGNPGMATGGMGDVLTGICAALIASGHSLREAAILGAWLSGRAAELAIAQGGESQESLTASTLMRWLGAACNGLRSC
jgi:NAD(P)H-hydrate epimerase